MWLRIKREAVSLFYSAEVKEVSKDFVILGSMLRLSLSYSIHTKACKVFNEILNANSVMFALSLIFPDCVAVLILWWTRWIL